MTTTTPLALVRAAAVPLRLRAIRQPAHAITRRVEPRLPHLAALVWEAQALEEAETFAVVAARREWLDRARFARDAAQGIAQLADSA